MLVLLQHLHIVLRDEYVEGKKIPLVLLSISSCPKVSLHLSKRPLNTEWPTVEPLDATM